MSKGRSGAHNPGYGLLVMGSWGDMVSTTLHGNMAYVFMLLIYILYLALLIFPP